MIIAGLIISSLLIMSLVFALDNTNSTNSTELRGTNYSRCILSCVSTSQVDHAKCVLDDKNNSQKCANDFKKCVLDIKNITNLTKKEVISSLRDCNKKNTLCKKEGQVAKNSCIKDVNNYSKVCKDQCQIVKPCPMNYNPLCGKDNITYSNECELNKVNATKDCKGKCPCKNQECKKEGEAIPVIPNAPKCCDGLELIKPKVKNIVGISGICTNKCGNGICDNDTESNYNCPKDCPVVKNYCKPSDRKNDTICNDLYMPVCGWFNSSIQCFAYPCASTYSNSCNACLNSNVSYWTAGECPKAAV